MFLKIGVLKNFENFTGKHLCSRLLLTKLRPLSLIVFKKHFTSDGPFIAVYDYLVTLRLHLINSFAYIKTFVKNTSARNKALFKGDPYSKVFSKLQ